MSMKKKEGRKTAEIKFMSKLVAWKLGEKMNITNKINV